MKLAVVGAGSTSTPDVIGLVRLRDAIHVDDLAFHDRWDDNAAARLLALECFDRSWPASIVHDPPDADIWLDEAAAP